MKLFYDISYNYFNATLKLKIKSPFYKDPLNDFLHEKKKKKIRHFITFEFHIKSSKLIEVNLNTIFPELNEF